MLIYCGIGAHSIGIRGRIKRRDNFKNLNPETLYNKKRSQSAELSSGEFGAGAVSDRDNSLSLKIIIGMFVYQPSVA